MSADSHFDVVVVGSGGAGMASAYFAAAAGLRTLVLERADVLGGTTAYSGGGLWMPAAAPLARAGIEDTQQQARIYLQALLGDDDPQGRREVFVHTAAAAMAALEQNPWLGFNHQEFPDYFDAPGRQPKGRAQHPDVITADELGSLRDGRVIEELVRPAIDDDWYASGKRRRRLSGGRALIARLLKALDETGHGTVITGARMTHLVTDEHGRVTGVSVCTDAGEQTFTAERGVILAAGGFEGSQSRRDEYGVAGAAGWTLGPRGTNEGEPIAAGAEIGAALDQLDQAWWCPGVVNADGSAMFSVGFRSGFFVNQRGERFGNEFLPYDRGGRQLNADPDRVPSWFVFDSREGGNLPGICLPTPDPAACLQSGSWVKADSIVELAGLIGVPSAALERTAARYNELATLGRDDDHGRGEDLYEKFFLFDPTAGKNPALPVLNQPPFFAARVVPADLGTKGGLVTDRDSRVLRSDGSAIEGLYAAGNTAAAWSRDRYPGPGVPIASGVVSGFRAINAIVGVTAS